MLDGWNRLALTLYILFLKRRLGTAIGSVFLQISIGKRADVAFEKLIFWLLRQTVSKGWVIYVIINYY